MTKKILVIDDEKSILQSLKAGLSDNGYEVFTHNSGKSVLDKVKEYSPHLIILDIKLPEVNGIEILKKIINYDSEIFVIMITAYGDTQTVVNSINIGAYDYIEKPFDLEQLLIIVDKVFNTKALKNEVEILKKQNNKYLDNKLVGKSASFNRIRKKIKVLAKEKVRVLLTGETGVGKGIIARNIHRYGNNEFTKERAFIEINCAAIASNLIESELFGHEKNAFTGAEKLKKGMLELADGGTVFLDEIGEIPINIQVKLLRFLEEEKFKRVGGVKDIKVDTRIIAATNRNIEKEIKKGNFRKDLFYRLNVVRINVPPLRKRKEDIIPLAEYFVEFFNKKLGKNIDGFSDQAKNMLLSYSWPGNVRELKNMVERILIFTEKREKNIRASYLPGIIFNKSIDEKNSDNKEKDYNYKNKINDSNFSLETEIEKIEKEYIEEALNKTDGNKTKAAKILGISRYSLYRRIEKYFD